MYSAYKLNKQGDNIQPCCSPFPILNKSAVPCLILMVASWPTHKFLRRHLRWSGILISKNFPQFVVILGIKVFRVVNETEVDFFLEFPCFLYDPANVSNWTSGSSALSKSSLYIWKFSVHVLLKPSLKNFEHNLASMWDECNWNIDKMFFNIVLLLDWNENWPLPVLWPLLCFPNLLTYSVQHFNSIIF